MHSKFTIKFPDLDDDEETNLKENKQKIHHPSIQSNKKKPKMKNIIGNTIIIILILVIMYILLQLAMLFWKIIDNQFLSPKKTEQNHGNQYQNENTREIHSDSVTKNINQIPEIQINNEQNYQKNIQKTNNLQKSAIKVELKSDELISKEKIKEQVLIKNNLQKAAIRFELKNDELIPKEKIKEQVLIKNKQIKGANNVKIVKAFDKTDKNGIGKTLAYHLSQRLRIIKNRKISYERKYKDNLGSLKAGSLITKQKFLNSLNLMETTGQPTITTEMQQYLNQEYTSYENRYNISIYKELPFCIVVPTYKNFKSFRYYYNLVSIVKQNYTNYHVIIVDDASGDRTAESIQLYLSIHQISKTKVVLQKNQVRKYHMANIYNSVVTHCQKGEILMIIDGDDQLIGRQVFKLFNAFYHQTQNFAIYSNHILVKRQALMDLGISLPYPKEIIQNNSYRTSQHYYSHLRSCLVDLFFEINPDDSLKNSKGVWYNNAVDNAIFLSIFEMSCGRISYLPEITYRYNTLTGNNIQSWNRTYRKDTAIQIKKSRQYICVNETKPELYGKLESILQSN